MPAVVGLKSIRYHLSVIVPKLAGDASGYNGSKQMPSLCPPSTRHTVHDFWHSVWLCCRDRFRHIHLIVFTYFLHVSSPWYNSNIIYLLFAVLCFIRYCSFITLGNSIRTRKIKLDQMKSILCKKEGLTGRRCQNIQSSFILRMVWG